MGLVVNVNQTKRCPFCAEEILRAAVKCKHCREFLAEALPSGKATRSFLPRPMPRLPADDEALLLSRALCQRMNETLSLWQELIDTDDPDRLVRHIRSELLETIETVEQAMRSVNVALGNLDPDGADSE